MAQSNRNYQNSGVPIKLVVHCITLLDGFVESDTTHKMLRQVSRYDQGKETVGQVASKFHWRLWQMNSSL